MNGTSTLGVCHLGLVTNLQKDSITQENVHRRVTRLVNSLSGRTYEDRLKTLGLPTLEYRRLRADVIQVYKILNQIDRVDIDKFFTLSELSTRGNSLKIFKPRSRLKVRSSVFSNRVVDVWNSTKLSSDGTFTELVQIKA